MSLAEKMEVGIFNFDKYLSQITQLMIHTIQQPANIENTFNYCRGRYTNVV